MLGKMEKKRTGFAVECSIDGAVNRVLYDPRSIAKWLAIGGQWHDVVDKDSLLKAIDFQNEVHLHHYAFGWELNIPVSGTLKTLIFEGAERNGSLYIAGGTTDVEAGRLFRQALGGGLMQNTHRHDTAGLFRDAHTMREYDGQLYDEVSRLNNELVTMQRRLAKNNVELGKLNKLKNQFLGMAAHDLRNPLGNIINLTEFLEDEKETLSTECLQFIEHIRHLSTYMLGLVNELLDYSVIESGSVFLNNQLIDLVDVYTSIVNLHRISAAQKGVDLVLETESASLPLSIDRGKVEQVLANLITNAIKFSSAETRISVQLSRENGRIVTSVSDQGCGMSREEIRSLFQPFLKRGRTGTKGEKSTGLGLYIVKRIIDALNGEIRVRSKPGLGTTISFSIPDNAE
jgi:two-component system, OmpR family, sensor kinase